MKTNESKTTSETKKDFQDAKLKVWYEEKNGSVCWYADNSDNLKTKTIKTSRGCGHISKTVGNQWKKISKKAAAEILANYGWTTDEFIAEYKKMEDEQSAILSRIRQETVIKYYVVTEEAMEVAIEAEINNASKAGEIVSTDNNIEDKAEVEMVEDERDVFSLLPSIDELNDVEISEPEIETPSTNKISSSVKINAVASYTLSAMCEEEAIRTEEEIEEAIEQNELVKSLKSQKAKASKKATKKITETERQQKWLENAKISDSNKYYIVPELDYKGVEANSNWKPCFYIVTNDLKLTRIGLKFAVELAALDKAIEVSKAQVATFKNNAKKAA